MRLVKQLRDEPRLRESFFDLAQRTFGIAFRGWYEEGWWGERYVPYALTEGDEVLANASVNRMDFLRDGAPFSCIQIGTVMTDPAHRNRGLARRLMEAILQDYGARPIYLFASDEAVGFYPKFGFRPVVESMMTLPWGRGKAGPQGAEGERGGERPPGQGNGRDRGHEPARRLDWNRAADRELFLALCRAGNPLSRLTLVDGAGLAAFYCRSELGSCLYFDEAAGLAAVAEFEGSRMILHDVFGGGRDLTAAVAAFARPDTERVSLGFLPKEPLGAPSPFDNGLFLRGNWPEGPILFPLLSRA